jgi:hypothetical protein
MLPVALPFIISAIGYGLNALGQAKAGNAAKALGQSESERLRYNALQAERQADDAIVRGHETASRLGAQVRGLVGAQKVGFAGQSVDVLSGSARDVQQDAERLGALDMEQIRRNAEREAFGFKAEATDLRLQADIARRGGRAQQAASRWGAATTLLGGAGSLALQKYSFDRIGGTSTTITTPKGVQGPS